MRFGVGGRKVRTTLLVFVVVFSLVGIFFFVFTILNSAKLNILVTPISATIKINGEEYKNGNYTMMPKGAVVAEISADGFETKTIQLNIEKDRTAVISTYLLGVGDDSFAVYMKSKKDFEILKLVVGDEHQDQIAKLFKKVQVREILPLRRVSRGSETYISDATDEAECSQVVCLRVKTNTRSMEVAKEVLAEAGYNISDYEVLREDI